MLKRIIVYSPGIALSMVAPCERSKLYVSAIKLNLIVLLVPQGVRAPIKFGLGLKKL